MARNEANIQAMLSHPRPLERAENRPVTAADAFALLLLGGLWGGSFLFMRVAAPEIGPITLVALRVALAACLLAPFLQATGCRHQAVQVAWLGLVNSALPFCLFAWAALHLPAALSAILNATGLWWSAIIGWCLFGTATGRRAMVGAMVSVLGVVLMVGHELLDVGSTLSGTGAAIAAAVAATACYGYGSHYSRRHLAAMPSRSVAAGSMLAAALVLALPGIALRPASLPSAPAALAALALGAFSTAGAYLLHFRLIERIGASRAMTVTVLVPAFGVVLGVVVLGEPLAPGMGLGGALVLLGCSLALGGRRS